MYFQNMHTNFLKSSAEELREMEKLTFEKEKKLDYKLHYMNILLKLEADYLQYTYISSVAHHINARNILLPLWFKGFVILGHPYFSCSLTCL